MLWPAGDLQKIEDESRIQVLFFNLTGYTNSLLLIYLSVYHQLLFINLASVSRGGRISMTPHFGKPCSLYCLKTIHITFITSTYKRRNNAKIYRDRQQPVKVLSKNLNYKYFILNPGSLFKLSNSLSPVSKTAFLEIVNAAANASA